MAVVVLIFWIKERKNISLDPRQFMQEQLQGVVEKTLPEKSQPKTVNFKWTYNQKNYTLTETLYGSIADFYAAQPKEFEYQGELPTDWKEKYFAMFLQVAPGDDTIAKIAADLKQAGQKNNLKDDQIVELVMAFVQAIPYDEAKAKLILAGSGQGLVSYPYETLYGNTGVCSDKSFLAYALLRHLGYGAALFVYEAENHMAVAVQCANQYSTYDSGYCLAETTAVGSRIGMIPTLSAADNQARSVAKLDYFDNSQDQFDEKNLGPVEIFEKSSGQTYAGIVNTLKISQQIDALSSWIFATKKEFVATNKKINADKAKLEDMRKDLDKLAKAEDAEDYNKMAKKYNNFLVQVQKEIKDYNAQIKVYNQKVNSYNGLIASF